MPRMIFVNLPVKDVQKSTDFYIALGATKDERFSDETASCLVFSESIFVMALSHEKFAQFTRKAIVDAKQATEVLVALSCESRDEVDQTIGRAVAAGGSPDAGPKQDFGFMYSRSFEDLDGHIFELVWMDVEAAMRAFGKDNAV
ncbi:MAG: VOC family protein [Beijerinckiaceae bacterium]|nr:VOC family protein [Beijerinckiaceae bacterium]